MKRYTSFKFIRMSEALKAQCELAAAKEQLHFSEWARDAFQTKLKAESRKSGKRRAA